MDWLDRFRSVKQEMEQNVLSLGTTCVAFRVNDDETSVCIFDRWTVFFRRHSPRPSWTAWWDIEWDAMLSNTESNSKCLKIEVSSHYWPSPALVLIMNLIARFPLVEWWTNYLCSSLFVSVPATKAATQCAAFEVKNDVLPTPSVDHLLRSCHLPRRW